MNIEASQKIDRSAKTKLQIIDCDIHPKASIEDYRPYLSNRWWDYAQTYGARVLQQLGRGRLGHVEHGRGLSQALHLMQRNQQQHLAALQATENADAVAGFGLVEVGAFHGVRLFSDTQSGITISNYFIIQEYFLSVWSAT